LAAGCSRTPQQEFDKGVAYFKEQKYATAADHFQKAVTGAQPTAQAWNFLGVCQLHEGKPDDALRSFQEALKLDATHITARYNFALALLERGQADQAIPHLAQLSQSPNCPPDTLYHLGLAYLRTGAWLKARQALEKSIATTTAMDVFNYLGMANENSGDYNAARLDFEQSIRSQPKYAPAYLNLATLEYRRLNNKAAAMQHYQQYLDLLPKDQQREDVRLLIVQIARELSGPTKSVPTAAATPPPAPKPAPAPTNMPAVVAAVAPPAPVVTPKPAVNPAPAPAPAPPPAPPKKTRIALAPHTLKAGNKTKAQAYFAEAVQKHQQNQIANAIQLYGQVIKTDPSYGQAYYNLAIAYRAIKQPDRALDNYELALMVNPGYTDARFNYALLLQEQGYTDDALLQYEKLIQSNPNEANLRLAAANLYALTPATHAKAREHYEVFLRLAPNSSQANAVRRWLDQTR
jgi:tetratricopeptide (TPR) repeat protein